MSQDRPVEPPSSSTSMSRRRLLLSAAALAAAPAAAWLGQPTAAHARRLSGPPGPPGPPRPPETDRKRAYHYLIHSMLHEDKNVQLFVGAEPGEWFLYRPQQLLVASADRERVKRRLEREFPVEPGKGFAGVDRLLLPRNVDIPRIVNTLRNPQQWPGERVPQVQPHHVTIGHENIMGNPDGPPSAAPSLAPPDKKRLGDGAGVIVGVCDTGIWQNAGTFHPAWLGGKYVPESDDVDALYSHADVLAAEGGHGTFVAGVLRQAAPGVRFDPEVALNPAGIGDEEMLVDALSKLDRATSIVNLSLGCYTQGDVAPMPIVNAIARLGQDVVVVASAGNSQVDRQTWPAAIPGVIGVAAVAMAAGGYVPAGYSNYGSWVDACAVGERVSTYVPGRFVLPALPPLPAPPVEVFSGFARWQGTSFAAPHVAGWLATRMTQKKITAVQARLDLLSRSRWDGNYGVLVT